MNEKELLLLNQKLQRDLKEKERRIAALKKENEELKNLRICETSQLKLTGKQKEILKLVAGNSGAGINNNEIVKALKNKKPRLNTKSIRSMVSVATGRLCRRGLITKHSYTMGREHMFKPVMEKIAEDFPELLKEAKTGK